MCGVQVPVYKGDELYVCHACNTCQQIDNYSGKVTAIAKMPPLPDVLARIKTGDSLSYEGDLYVVSGGVFQKYKEGYAILWVAHSYNNVIWIEEETGGLMVLHASNDLLGMEQKKKLIVGQAFTVYPNKPLFTVTGIIDLTDQIFTGSFPNAMILQQRMSIWMQNDVGGIYRMALDKQLNGISFVGKTLNEESRALLLNKIPSAHRAAQPVQVHSCPVCRNNVPVFAAQQSTHLICSSCFSLLASAGRGVSVLKNRGNAFRTGVALKIGDQATIENVRWTIIAIHEKNEAGTSYYWREYTLFHPEYPYHFLSEFDGHWNFLRPVEGIPEREKQDAVYEKNKYEFFLKGRAITRTAAGEFQGMPDYQGRTETREYVSPPLLISSELAYSTFGWYQGQYIKRKEVANAFGKTLSQMPAQHGVGSSQPTPEFIIPRKWLFASFMVPFVVLFLIQVIFTDHKSTVVFSERYTLPDSISSGYSVVTPSFMLDNGKKNLEVTLNSDISNNWSEATVILTNESTLQEYATNVGTEYYSGMYDGERWEEGKPSNTSLLTAVPEGRYRAEISLSSGTNNQTGRNIQLLFTRDVPTQSNFWWSVVAVSILPLILLLRRHFFEKRRWSNSDYTE
jgi:hypothetical protein